jgi:hypothetical protein
MKQLINLKGIAFWVTVPFFVLLGVIAWLLTKSPTHDCPPQVPTASQQFHAVKVVIQPWTGRHEVYGIFMLPLQYRSGRTYKGTISINDFSEEFVPDWHLIDHAEGIDLTPGHYLVQRHLSTRIALRFLLRGHFADLKLPCNWTLDLMRRSRS